MRNTNDMEQVRQRMSGSRRRSWIIIFACALALLQSALLMPGCAAKTPPANVVLITIDTLRADHVGCYGYDRDTTPNIDRFAAKNTVFANAFAPMPTTLPSHSSIMTSLYPFEHGVRANGWKLDEKHTTLAEILREKGYATAAFTSVWGIGEAQGLAQGFDTLEQSKYFGVGVDKNERLAEHTTAMALDWLKARQKEDPPFFLWVHYWDPHSDYNPPEPARSMFSSAQATAEVDGTTECLMDLMKKKIVPLPADRDYLVNLYDGEIRYTDEQVGKLLDFLENNRNTLTILVADHGESFGENDSWAHSLRLYEENIRVPLIISLPVPVKAGAVVESQAELVDIMPTVLDFLSIQTERELSGQSLRRAIEGRDLDVGRGIIERQYISEEYSERFGVETDHLLGIRRWPYKFMMKSSGHIELFNLAVDPREQNNLAGEQAELVEAFKAESIRNLELIREIESPGMGDETRNKLKALGYL